MSFGNNHRESFEQRRARMRDAHDRTERRAGAAFVVWFAFCLFMGLAAFSVAIWAIISLVNWLTTK